MLEEFGIDMHLHESHPTDQILGHGLDLFLRLFHLFRRTLNLNLVLFIRKFDMDFWQVLCDFLDVGPFASDYVLVDPSGGVNIT